MNARVPMPKADDDKSSPKEAEKVSPGKAMGAFVLGTRQYEEFVNYMANPGEPSEKWSKVAQEMQEYREKKKNR